MKCKPIVYFSPRHASSPACSRVIKSLSRHVTIVGESEDPEVAYTSINECDVFLCYLNPAICRKLFLIYELGVAFVLRKPVLVIRETELKFSEILIPKHFYETRLLIPPTATYQTCNLFGKPYNFPVTLGDVLAYSYQNSVVFCADLHAKCVALLLDKILGLSGDLGTLEREPSSPILKLAQLPAVKITLGDSKSSLQLGLHRPGLQGYSIEADMSERGKISLRPLNEAAGNNEELKTTSFVNEDKLSANEDKFDKLSANENYSSANYTPEMSITSLESMDNCFPDNCFPDKLQSKNWSKPVTPVIYEFPGETKSPGVDSDEGLCTSESSSPCDHTYLHDKSFIASENTSPLPSPTPPLGIYYPTALPVYPMELSFPPFHVEKLLFNKYAIQIEKADRLPSIIRRRIMGNNLSTSEPE